MSFRNRIINGSAIIGQRGVVASASAQAIYGTDRMISGAVSGSGINVNLFKSTFGGSTSGLAHIISGSMTAGVPYWAQRIEAQNVVDLNGKYVTISGLVYHNTGSTQNFVVRLSKANALDNFSAVTQVAQGSAVAVPDNTVTPVSATFLLGSTDATNGLIAEVFSTANITCTAKTFGLGDFQLERGVSKTPFEIRPIGLELTLCQRYYEIVSGVSIATRPAYTPYSFKVSKRIAPTLSVISGSVAGANYAVTNADGFTCPEVTIATGTSGWSIAATAEL